MKTGFLVWQKLLVSFLFFIVAIVGFMIKLPSGFRHFDKELHTLFYFLAAAFLNVLFANTKMLRHVVIFIGLYLFGVAIEFGQSYSNTFFRTRIHGRFDPEDVQANLKGLVAFSLLWLLYMIVIWVYKKGTVSKNSYDSNVP